MRISTQHMFETGAASIGDLQSRLVKTQQQISSERRILTPSDDPVGAARALELTQSQSLNTQYGVNRMYAKNSLGELDGVLSSVTALLQEVKITVVTAKNGTLGDTERGFMATDLRARFDQLLGLANSRNGVGEYMFSGFRSATAAFSETAPGVVQYQGDQGQRLLQVDSARQMSLNSSGAAVFQGAGSDMFETLNDLIVLLQTPGTPSSASLAIHDGKLDQAMENVLTVRASVGSRMQELEALDYAGEDRSLQYSQALSGLQDLDYTKAITQLSQQQIALEAAQKSFVKTSGLSLFNFI